MFQFDYLFEERYTLGIIIGIIFGLVARLYMLQTDYRQYPTYPHGIIVHMSLGVIAAGLGSVAIPALFEQDYTAVTFLALAAQQFRDVRSMERETLTKIDSSELVPRGSTYIEGIALVFEGRNYLVIFTSFFTALFVVLFSFWVGILAGIVTIIISAMLKTGKTISHVADVYAGKVNVEKSNVYVDDIYMMNVGLKVNQDLIKQHAIGIVLVPKNKNSAASLSNLGQRKAILHDLSTVLGAYRDSGEPALIPMAKLDINDGRLGILLVVKDCNIDKAVQMVKNVPLLESSVRMPSEAPVKGGE
ncbi:YIEGIA family protein [Longirhabdus pacifica]|uniref:YIEGIA family protein n=1 Tax=Longirhabdus pacifica TaxID=2305227 RepID=UPI001008C3C6|nr:YIEGIA family protein [Longirhabdus pacifica]